MDLRQLRYFIALNEHRSFVRAADAMGITQPAFSRSIQALERQGLRREVAVSVLPALLAIFLGDSPLVKEFRAEKRPEGADENWKGRSAKSLFNEWYNDEERASERPTTVPVLFEGVKIRLQSKA